MDNRRTSQPMQITSSASATGKTMRDRRCTAQVFIDSRRGHRCALLCRAPITLRARPRSPCHHSRAMPTDCSSGLDHYRRKHTPAALQNG